MDFRVKCFDEGVVEVAYSQTAVRPGKSLHCDVNIPKYFKIRHLAIISVYTV
jgi:hypothetical protein